MKKAILITLCLVFGFSTLVFAGANEGVAKGIVHVRDHSEKAGCNYGTFTTCSDINTTVAGFSFDAFPVFYDLNEFKGCEYSLDWPVEWGSATFTNCADFVIGAVTLPVTTGASHTWEAQCTETAFCVPAYLWIYAAGPGEICMYGHPQHGAAYVLDCSLVQDVLIGWGCAGVYGATGNDPCGVLPAPANEPTTWGEIKSMFK